ncbi:MAG: PQQ-dependent sugar dehydrogenase [Gemmatimonadetes bacterium]|nr:PQQ-dependent sugar dehydrogenase [Gemmatimonadota bacterium]
MNRRSWLVIALLACADSPADDSEPGPGPPALTATIVASGLSAPVHLAAPIGDARLFVVEQAGRIRIVRDAQLLQQPFLDITDIVGSGGERGLLSVAFHPAFVTNGLFFVNYTDRAGATRIERYRVSADPERADRGSAKLLLTIAQPFANHNGGLIAFGPDGNLWIGMGDGGSRDDPQGNGQNPATLLGAMLRINVDAGDPYAIPADNPFVSVGGARPEIWAIGLRNPWRFAFDRSTGELYIADVGQEDWEEVNAAPVTAAGLNYGWNTMEGRHCFRTVTCNTAGLTLPVLEYGHGEGCSITGGHVYRGAALPFLRGHFVYGDYCGGWVRSFRRTDSGVADAREWPLGSLGRILSFGEDVGGELYVMTDAGRVYRLDPAS